MKKIITDCDGVLLDWAFAFDVWMSEQGLIRLPNTDQEFLQSKRYGISQKDSDYYITKFNQSGSLGYLPAFKDSVEYVTKFAEKGYRFEVISSLNADKYAQNLRARNLKHIFGDVFDYIDSSLSHTQGKRKVLEDRYKGKDYIWLEDKVSNAIAGDEVGLNTYIMDMPYNKEYKGKRIQNWKELYDTTQ